MTWGRAMESVGCALAVAAGVALALGGCSDDAEVQPAAGGVPTGGSHAGGMGGSDGGGGAGAGVAYDGAVGEVTFLGPWGGAATSIAADPTDADRVYAIVGGQVFVSTDAGHSWQQGAPVELDALSMLVMADGRLIVGTSLDLLESTDEAGSWTSIKHDVEQGYGFGIQVGGIAYEEGSPGRLWIGLGMYGTAPIWSLEDGQTSWQPWTPPADWATSGLNGAGFTSISVAADPNTSETLIFASCSLDFGQGGGVFCSVDSGVSFADCSTGLPPAPYHRLEIFDDMVVIAGGQIFGSAFAGVYYSTDLGTSWAASTGGWSQPIANDFVRLASGEFLAGTYGSGLIGTADLTSDWQPVGFAGMTLNSVIELDGGGLLVGPEQLGVYASSDQGSSWEAAATGLNRVVVEDAYLDPTDPSSVLAGMSSQNSGLVIHTATGIDGWGTVESLPHPRYSLVYISPSGRWYVVSDGPTTMANDGIYVSDDAGASFDFVGPLDGDKMDHDLIGLVEWDDGQHLVTAGKYWADGNWEPFIVESIDGGGSWTELWTGTSQNMPRRLAATESGDLFLAVQGEPLVHVSPDGTLSTMAIPGVVDDTYVDIAACYRDAGRLVATARVDPESYDLGGFVSSDGGSSWDLFELGADEQPVYVATHPYDCDLIFAASSEGRVLYSEDAGESWTEIDLGHPLGISRFKVVGLTEELAAALVVSGVGGVAAVSLTTSVQ